MNEKLGDFEIRIHSGEDGRSLVHVEVEPDDRRTDGEFVSPYNDAEVRRAIQWIEEGRFDSNAQEFGAGLFRALFAGRVGDVYRDARAHGRLLRFRFIFDEPLLSAIPWELLYDPDRQVFLALECPLVRGLSLLEPTQPLEAEPPLRILIIDAFPKGVAPLEGQVEAAGIEKALAPLSRGRRVEVRRLSHATLPGLQNALREAGDRPIHILHFIGHGRHDVTSGRTVLLFEDEGGERDEVDAETMATILRPYEIRLVFLNACQSVQWSAVDGAQTFAPFLLRIGIPAVIGMQVSVLDSTAIEFSRRFYEALADNRRIDEAVRDARQLIRATPNHGRADMGIPICYLRARTGVILQMTSNAVPLTVATWRPWLRQQMTPRRVAAGLIGVITVAATLIGLYSDVLVFFRKPPPMSGDFNVAVAEFRAIDGTGRLVESLDAAALASQMYERLDAELVSSFETEEFDIKVQSPSDTGPIQGASRDERAEHAADLGENIRADLIVYGTLHTTKDGYVFQPEFYLTDRTLRNAEELVGQYELGQPQLADPSNPVVSQRLRESVLTRTQALAQFVIGLGYYAVEDYEEAQARFRHIETTLEWEDRDGKEILYLFLGNASARLLEYAVAAGYYEDALKINESYARAQAGRAEVLFQTSREACEPDTVKPGGLDRAAAEFRKALEAAFQPALSDISTKVAFGLGRVYLCQRLAGLAAGGDADAEFRKVINEFESGNERVRELASESHAALGLGYISTGDSKRAADEYLIAIDMTTSNDRKAIFYEMLGFIYNEEDDDEAARQAYQRAAAEYLIAIDMTTSNGRKAILYGMLGSMYSDLGDGEAARQAYQSAAAEYLIAIDMTSSNDRKAVFYAMLGSIYNDLGDDKAAIQAYQRAIDLTSDETERVRLEEEMASVVADHS